MPKAKSSARRVEEKHFEHGCRICWHPERAIIDAMLLRGQNPVSVAESMGVPKATLIRHNNDHLQAFVNSLEQLAADAALNRVMAYRDQVNLPLKEKSKFIENELWGEMEKAKNLTERVSVYREIRNQQGEQAKLSGAYQKEGTNATDLERVVKAIREWHALYPNATPQERQSWLEWFAQGSGIEREAIAQQLLLGN